VKPKARVRPAKTENPRPAAQPRQPDRPLAADPIRSSVQSASASATGAPVAGALYSGALALALVALALSLIPIRLVPVAVAVRLERNRPTLAVAGLAIVTACAVAGLLTSGQ
jgi:hypothetical protein